MDNLPESLAVRLKLAGHGSWSHALTEPRAVRLKLKGTKTLLRIEGGKSKRWLQILKQVRSGRG